MTHRTSAYHNNIPVSGRTVAVGVILGKELEQKVAEFLVAGQERPVLCEGLGDTTSETHMHAHLLRHGGSSSAHKLLAKGGREGDDAVVDGLRLDLVSGLLDIGVLDLARVVLCTKA